MTRDSHYGITEQEKASVHRREDARVLFEQSRWRGSMSGDAAVAWTALEGCHWLRQCED
jgi:hypothetical protein